MVILHVMTVWQKQFFKEQRKEAEKGVKQENLGYPTLKNRPKWTYIPFSPLSKVANCGEVSLFSVFSLVYREKCFYDIYIKLLVIQHQRMDPNGRTIPPLLCPRSPTVEKSAGTPTA